VVDFAGSGGVGVVPRCMGSGRLEVKEEEDGVGGDLGTRGSRCWLATEVEEESVEPQKRRCQLGKERRKRREERGTNRYLHPRQRRLSQHRQRR